VVALLDITRDMTERRQAEEALQKRAQGLITLNILGGAYAPVYPWNVWVGAPGLKACPGRAKFSLGNAKTRTAQPLVESIPHWRVIN